MEVVAELLVRVAHTTQKALLEQAKAASQAQAQATPSQSQSGADHPVVKQEPQGTPGTPALNPSDSSPPGHTGGSTAGGAGAGAMVPRAKRPRLSDWMDQLAKSEEVRELQAAVRAFASTLPMPGFGHFKVE